MRPRAAHCARWRFSPAAASWPMTTSQFLSRSQMTYPAGSCQSRNAGRLGCGRALEQHARSGYGLGFRQGNGCTRRSVSRAPSRAQLPDQSVTPRFIAHCFSRSRGIFIRQETEDGPCGDRRAVNQALLYYVAEPVGGHLVAQHAPFPPLMFPSGGGWRSPGAGDSPPRCPGRRFGRRAHQEVVAPIEESTGISTNTVAQSALETIEVLEMCGDRMG